MQTLTTDILEIAYIDEGPRDAPVALMLHGWPDDAHGMVPVAQRLRAHGYRTVVPWLRGFGPTRFLRADTMRDGRAVALAQDAIDLLDRLGVDRCLVVGHDWGGRTEYSLAALVPDRLIALATLGIGYAPKGRFEVPAFRQAKMWWYQWLMTTDDGAAKVRQDPVGFARIQWETWSPRGWFDEQDFARTAESFRNPDWPSVTLHGYRSRWKREPVDLRYADAQAKVEATQELLVPTLLIVGQEDRADYPEEADGKETCFPAGYRRIVLDEIGHFPAREAPDQVAEAIAAFTSSRGSRRGPSR